MFFNKTSVHPDITRHDELLLKFKPPVLLKNTRDANILFKQTTILDPITEEEPKINNEYDTGEILDWCIKYLASKGLITIHLP